MRSWDIAVIGAGVVGLACAALLSRGFRVIVLEKQAGPARETSSRNSGVVHAGIYYPPGSLKAKLCVRGRELVYARAARDRIAHLRTGKLIVATESSEIASLETIRARALAAGVDSLELIDGRELARREPLLSGVAALWSPESGVVDAHGLCESYRRELATRGGDLALLTDVVGFEPAGDGVRVDAVTAGERHSTEVSYAINAAGLDADRIAALAGTDVAGRALGIRYVKGDYFSLASHLPRPNCALVYPVPEALGLGIHLTVDVGGRCIAGPDATPIDRLDYGVDPAKASAFAESVARYFPSVRPEDLAPDYSGIRPKLAPRPGERARDFEIFREGPFVQLVGIESPGLTASEAIGEVVRDLIFAQA
jgi:L-2-hydroxyglutarate oxidase LhgO